MLWSMNRRRARAAYRESIVTRRHGHLNAEVRSLRRSNRPELLRPALVDITLAFTGGEVEGAEPSCRCAPSRSRSSTRSPACRLRARRDLSGHPQVRSRGSAAVLLDTSTAQATDAFVELAGPGLERTLGHAEDAAARRRADVASA